MKNKKKALHHPLFAKEVFESDLKKFIRAVELIAEQEIDKEDVFTHPTVIEKFIIFQHVILRGEK